jgi:hypothetical protein
MIRFSIGFSRPENEVPSHRELFAKAKKPERNGRFIPFESAVKTNSASFSQVAEAWYFQKESNENAIERQIYAEFFPLIYEAFQHEHGSVRDLFWGPDVAAAVVVTKKNELYAICDARDPTAVVDLMNRACEDVKNEAQRLVAGKALRVTQDRIYALATNLVARLSECAENQVIAKRNQSIWPGSVLRGIRTHAIARRIQRQVEEDIVRWSQELTKIETYYRRAAKLRAASNYSFGMLTGFIALLLAVWVGYAALGLNSPIAWAAVGGGLGGVVSVFTQMSTDSFPIDYEPGMWRVLFFGAIRPLLAAGLAFSAYVVIASGLIPLMIPADPDKQRYFYATVGLLAGFSERWARDIVEGAGGQLKGLTARTRRSGEEPTSPSAEPREK